MRPRCGKDSKASVKANVKASIKANVQATAKANTKAIVKETVKRHKDLPPTEAIKITTMAGCSTVKNK